MPIRKKTLISTNLDSDAEVQSGDHYFNGVTPKRITFYVSLVEVGAPAHTSTTLTVETSPDGGTTLLSYDKLITDAGVDGPVSSVAYLKGTTTQEDVVSMSLEDVVDYIKVTLTVAGTPTSSKYITANVYMLAEY